MIIFEYQGKIYKPSNLENKLKKLGVTINDVKILEDTETRAEKEKKEQNNKISAYDAELSVWWDNKVKGYYIKDVDAFKCGVYTWINDNDDFPNPSRYTFIGRTYKSELKKFTKEHWKEVLDIIYKKKD